MHFPNVSHIPVLFLYRDSPQSTVVGGVCVGGSGPFPRGDNTTTQQSEVAGCLVLADCCKSIIIGRLSLL